MSSGRLASTLCSSRRRGSTLSSPAGSPSMVSRCPRIGYVSTNRGFAGAAIRSRVTRNPRRARCGRARLFGRAPVSPSRIRRGGDPRNDGLGPRAVDQQMESLTFNALGGECELYGIGVGQASLAEGETWIRSMHDRLTRFEPSSELSRFNASSGEWVTVSAELEALLRESLRAFEISDGLVNVAV